MMKDDMIDQSPLNFTCIVFDFETRYETSSPNRTFSPSINHMSKLDEKGNIKNQNKISRDTFKLEGMWQNTPLT